MRTVLREDQDGYLRAWLIRDNDPDEVAEQGIPLDPPPISEVDWEAVEREIHNALVRRGIFTTQDLTKSNDKVLAIACRSVRRHVVLKFKEEERNGRN